MARKDFIPGGEAEFLVFATVFCEAATTHAADPGIPAVVITALNAKSTAYTAAYNTAGGPNTGKLDREDRKEKREALTGDIRKVKNAYIDTDSPGVVTDEIRLAFGLEAKDRTRTEVPAPTEVVPFELASGEYLQIVVTHPAKPVGYNGAVAFNKVSGEVPADNTALTQSKLLTRPREILTFFLPSLQGGAWEDSEIFPLPNPEAYLPKCLSSQQLVISINPSYY
ncbi:MAG: hypothetical protein LBS55_02660 [Prevotellaceae bacterium]|jgi:hypothetical protein|nr:hypothetical protein [Prevotellaceae bacterium]